MMDTKTLLKEAKNALKNKNFRAALRLSKSIIKEDRENYTALVFLGLSLQEIGPVEQAPKAFQKAIDLNPSNPLAWQGLISYHEKLGKEETKYELVKLYSSYLGLETNETKLLEYSERLTSISAYGDIKEICNILIEISKKCEIENQRKILKLAAGLLESIRDEDKPFELYEKCLCLLLSTSSVSEAFYSTYLTLLNKTRQYSKTLEHSLNMYKLFPSSTTALSWICKMFNQIRVEGDTDMKCDNIQDLANQLLRFDPKNAMGLFTRALLLFENNQIGEAKEILDKVTTQRPGLLYAWVLLTDVLIQSHLVPEAKVTIEKSKNLLKLVTDLSRIDIKIKSQEFNILCISDDVADWNKAVEMSSQNDFDLKDSLPEFIELNINLRRFSKAEKYISKLDEDSADLYRLRMYRFQEKWEEAINLVQNSQTNSPKWWLEVGQLYWQMNEHTKSLEPFLKAAKLDKKNYLCFVHLGHYYYKVGQLDKARRCHEMAFKLNPSCSEAGCELSKIYRKQQNWDANLSLLTNLTQGVLDRRKIWAWFQLGLTYLEQGSPANAIEYLRLVLRLEPENIHCWESLADAYFTKGAYTSALKCYQKAAVLSEYSLYSALQIAFIKKILGDFVEAKKDFEDILLHNNQYVPALKGLSETCLCQANEYLSDQRIGRAQSYAQIAATNITLAILQQSELCCLWKLLADCVHFIAKLPEKFSFMRISQCLLQSVDETDTTKLIEEEDLLNFAINCYCKAVSLDNDNPFLWHDLASCYLTFGIKHRSSKPEMFERALLAAQHCTVLNPEHWQHWNLLGNIAILQPSSDFALAQHSFIKAVVAESNSAVAWSNLGILYFVLEDFSLANKAFGEGQRSDPNYVNSWIGQALIAETMAHSDAMGLFRHSTQLGQHQQGSLGYAHWVCRMLLTTSPNDKAWQYNIRNMHAIPVAYDSINWYTEKNPDDACAWNMLGILSERLGLLETAKRAFKVALVLAAEDHKDVARVNYGRLLYRTGDYRSAIEMFSSVGEATFSSGGGLALALFKNGQYEESYTAYEQALHWLTEEQIHQSELLVALASMAYKFQGIEGAKTLLFQSIELKPPSPWSLYATLSLSLLHSDLKLAQLVLEELLNFEISFERQQADYEDYIYHYATLLSHFYLLKDDTRGGVIGLSKLIHKHPHLGSSWLILSQLILRLESDRCKLKAGAKCANSALKLGQTNMAPSKVLCLAALSCQRAGDFEQAKLLAQKSIHCHPDRVDGWATLVPLLTDSKTETLKRNLTRYFVSIKCSESLLQWIQVVTK